MTDGYLLIAWHGRTGTSEALAASAAEGAADNGSLLPAADVTPDDLLAAAGYLFVCPENLASMSGEMKEMFDRCYYPVLGKLNGRPFATIIAAGSDGEGAQRQIDRIAKGWRLKRVAEPWIVNTEAQSPEAILAAKTLDPATLQTAREMGEALGEAVASGML
ncbi:MAG: flavodoxin [Altererythrobacter sp.]|nr:flavodoxin [Erythrobacter sp.]MBK63647.1 flavodoxin [Altererythrobacter sp.]|tara:strand:+ start:42 stop:527 length:486 start_codon:yes stop_codon:yes gene_type:complete